MANTLAFNARAAGSIPGWGIKSPYAAGCDQELK